MKFNYKFSNLLGTVYRNGNLVFSPDGNCVLSPVGNKISCFDLKNNRSSTLPIESRFNYTSLALSPNGITLLAVNEEGEVHLISLISKTILRKLRTNRTIKAVEFSPDGKYFAITKESNVLVYSAPGPASRDYGPFTLERVLKGAFDETSCLTWSTCSQIVAVGSKDTTTRIYAIEKFKNLKVYCLGGHSEPIVNVFFQENSLTCYTLSRNGHLLMWKPSVEHNELEKETNKDKRSEVSIATMKHDKKLDADDNNADYERDEFMNDDEEQEDKNNKKSIIASEEDQAQNSNFFYTRVGRHFLRDALPQEEKMDDDGGSDMIKKKRKPSYLTASDYHKNANILVTGFSNGVFLIHEIAMNDVNLIHSLRISDQSILSISLNITGDWIAFGCEHFGQLLVWEWQSETYVLKQQGHFNSMNCIGYSPDGTIVATGGDDGKIKLWNTSSGFCFVTFSEHTAAVTGLVFAPPSGKVLLSASMDGTVRAFDLNRYRNFRTFTSPRPAQFGCIGVDSSGDLVAAGGIDIFEIYLWSVQTGKLLEVISGHDGPVSSLSFSPSVSSSIMASVSWDKTLRLWNAIAAGSSSEIIQLGGSDGTAVTFRPDGGQVAVATLNGQITFFDSNDGTQTGTIDGRADLEVGRSDTDLITAKKSKDGKGFFTTLAYTADGSCILAGGQSKSICIYHIKEMLLIKKFEVTQNRSFDAMDGIISRKKLSEFGTNLDLIEDRDDPAGGTKAIRLPGTKKGDMSSRVHRPEVRVSGLQFAPTSREFAATTTEGLLIYSLDSQTLFDPFELELEVTPVATRLALGRQEYGRALSMALKLNQVNLTREIIEQLPIDKDKILLLAKDLPQRYELMYLFYLILIYHHIIYYYILLVPWQSSIFNPTFILGTLQGY